MTRAKEIGINLRANTAVLVSNSNLYHCNDVNAVIDAMTYSGFDKKGVLLANQTLLNGSGEEKPYITDFHKGCLERFIVLQPGQRVGINEIEIEALKTTKDAIGFKFYTPRFTLAYSSDTKYSSEIAEQYKDAGILILNFSNPYKEGNTGLTQEDVVKIMTNVNPRLAIITGFGNKMLEADPLYIAREIQKETGVQIIAARDGMVVSPVSYSAQQGQRTFGTFARDNRKVDVRAPEQKEETAPGVKEEQQTTIAGAEEQLDSQQNIQ